MGFPAARLSDMHTCPMCMGVPAPIAWKCAWTVLTGNLPQARVTDMCVCVGPPPPLGGDPIVTGAWNVLVEGMPAARMTDLTLKGGAIVTGFPTVLIGMQGGGAPPMSSPAGLGAAIGNMLASAGNAISDAISSAVDAVQGVFAGPAPGAGLQDAVDNVNPENSVINCGNIIDATAARLNGTDPNAVASAERDGSFSDIENRFNTDVAWGSDFQSAYDAVEAGGDGTQAIVGIGYSGGGSHVVLLANDGGTVGIVEGQNWGEDNPAEVITDVDRANERYNSDGGSNVGWGLVGSRD
ncbi:PAAR domain-containing protein [Labrenzia sp. OB1]|uniref:PAAR domain-containing protein n=1 Tax=Labrenzia sp. OB1 TaxID=1561204 RepID=UPI0012E786B2|nr:PAAR domain-containing protein [Labrenzia sp. OB1]